MMNMELQEGLLLLEIIVHDPILTDLILEAETHLLILPQEEVIINTQILTGRQVGVNPLQQEVQVHLIEVPVQQEAQVLLTTGAQLEAAEVETINKLYY
jgi:hypothetical protein